MKTLFSICLLFLLHALKAQTQDWVSLPQELNGVVRDMVVYKGQLIACGSFTASGTNHLKNIAAWDGTQWTALGKGIRYYSESDNSRAMKMTVFNDELYVVGKFDSAGTVASVNIAKWDGTSWLSLNNLGNGSISTVIAYKNEIYVGGDFTWMQNVQAYGIAKYDGFNWHAFSGNTNFQTQEFCLYQNDLYVIGNFYSTGAVLATRIASWDGVNWHGLGNTDEPSSTMTVWDGKLLVPNFVANITNLGVIRQWDGTNWSAFSAQYLKVLWEFYTFNGKLYCAYTTQGPAPTPISSVEVLNESTKTWSMVGTGLTNGVFALCEYNGELYCAGEFKKSIGDNHNYIAKLSTITGIVNSASNNLEVNIFPNPVKDKLNLEFAGAETNINFSISNTLGQMVLNDKTEQQNTTIDLSGLQSGVYYLKIENSKTNKVLKLIKE